MIKTERLIMDPVNVKYYKDLLEIWSNFEVTKYTYLEKLSTEEESLNRLIFWVDTHIDFDYPNIFVITLEEKAIGVIGFPIMDKEKQDFGLFYQLGEEYWGRGYMKESVRGIINYIYEEYTEATIYADAVDENLPSLKILRDLEFKEINIEEKGFSFNGFELDLIKFIYKK